MFARRASGSRRNESPLSWRARLAAWRPATATHRPLRSRCRRARLEPLEDRRLLAVSLSGMAWKDANANGIHEAGERGMAGTVVELFQSTDDTVGNADDVSRGVVVTDANGQYRLGHAAGGMFYLAFRVPVGFAFSPQDQGGNDTTDSDADATGFTAMVTLAQGQTQGGGDLGVTGAADPLGFAVEVGPRGNYAQGIATDTAGNVYVAGTFGDTIDLDPGPGAYTFATAGDTEGRSIHTAFVAKYTSEGALLWARCFNTNGWTFGEDVAIGADGSVFVAGTYSGTGDFDFGSGVCNLASRGYKDIFISKLDAAGNFVWARSLGGGGIDEVGGIAAAADGSLYITGTLQASRNINSAQNIIVSKLDSSGNFLWLRRMGGNASYGNFGMDLALTSDGAAIVTGVFAKTVDFDPGPGVYSLTSAGLQDVFVLKLDALGNFAWVRSMSGRNDEWGHAAAVSPEGAIYTTGSFSGTVDFDPGTGVTNLTSAGEFDVFVSMFDASGNFVWAKSLGAAGHDGGRGITLALGGGVIVTGSFRETVDFDPGPRTYPLASAGSRDIFFLKLDGSGNFVWARRMGGQMDDSSDGIAVATDGSIFASESREGFWLAKLLDSDPVVQLPTRRGQERFTLRRHGDNVELIDDATGARLLDQPLASLQSVTIAGADSRTDRVTIDLSHGGTFVLPGGVIFRGGKGAADTLAIRATAGADVVELRAGGLVVVNGLSITTDGLEKIDIDGRQGNDTYRLAASGTAVVLRDASGTDTLDFSKAAKGIAVNLVLNRGQAQRIAPWGKTLALEGTIERVLGTPFADVISGNAANNVIWGRAGNDTIRGGNGNDLLFGDQGNDRLFGGRGSDVLVGGGGEDKLFAEGGRDIAIGGDGRDTLFGAGDDDLLIGGSTTFDANAAALQAIRAEWDRAASLATRMDHLGRGGGLNGGTLLQKERTVLADTARDALYGGGGRNWALSFAEDRAIGI